MIRVYQLGLFSTNCYVYKNYLIDPAGNDFPEDFDFSSIDTVLLTHGHLDHLAGLYTVLEHKPDIPVFIDQKDFDAISIKNEGYHKEMFGPFGEAMFTQMYKPFEVKNIKIYGKDELPFEIINTPGHTPGSVCIKDNDILFSGDTLFRGGMGRTDLKGGSYSELHDSLEKLSTLSGNIKVYPGHGDATTISEEFRQRY